MSRMPCYHEATLAEFHRQEDEDNAKWESYLYDIEFYVDELTCFEYSLCEEFYDYWNPDPCAIRERIEGFREFSQLLSSRLNGYGIYLSEEKLWEEFSEGDYVVDITYNVTPHLERIGLYSCLGHDFTKAETSKQILRQPLEKERMYA